MSVEAYYKSDQPAMIDTPKQMDELIDNLLNEPFDNSIAALYHLDRPTNSFDLPDHEMYVAVNAQDKIGGVYYMGQHHGEHGSWYSKGRLSKYNEVSYCITGSTREFPQDSEIPLDLVRQAAQEFLLSGGNRPECIDWQLWQPELEDS